jgi:hypothetical protein
MSLLLVAALLVAIAIGSLTAYVWRHPLDMSMGGLRHLRKGLALATGVSVLLVAAYSLWMFALPRGFTPLFVLVAGAGNLANAASLIYGLRELTGFSLAAAMLILLGQMLWISFYVMLSLLGGS